MKKMNDHVSLLLQGYAAKRKLAELFESKDSDWQTNRQ
jgi:hypothetical protein